MIILSRNILKKKPGAVIIGDVKCSQLMFDDIERRGGIPVMWKTRHSLVKDKMKKEGALLAGEISGHIFIAMIIRLRRRAVHYVPPYRNR